MARLPKAEPILQAAREWRDRCLIEDGSIFTEERVWHGDNVAELDKYFVQNLDYGEGDFQTKLEAQLGQPFAVDVTVNGFRIQARTIDLSRPFQLIRDEMLAVLDLSPVAPG